MTSTSSSKVNLVTPPTNFAAVEEDVYRGAYPSPSHARFLQGLGLRTAVALSLEALPMQSRRMLEGQGVRVVHLSRASWARYHNFDPDMITEALRIILDADTHPLLLMCATGELQTNAVVGALRRVQRWCFASILAEMYLFQSTVVPPHRTALLEAVESFDAEYFTSCFVQPRIAAQKMAMLAVEEELRGRDNVEAAPVACQPTESSPEPPAIAAEPSSVAVINPMANPNLAAPLPLWFLRIVKHSIAAEKAMRREVATGDHHHGVQDGEATTTAAMAAAVAARQHVHRSVRALPHERYRFTRLAPLISDPNGYNPAESLVDSDDD